MAASPSGAGSPTASARHVAVASPRRISTTNLARDPRTGKGIVFMTFVLSNFVYLVVCDTWGRLVHRCFSPSPRTKREWRLLVGKRRVRAERQFFHESKYISIKVDPAEFSSTHERLYVCPAPYSHVPCSRLQLFKNGTRMRSVCGDE